MPRELNPNRVRWSNKPPLPPGEEPPVPALLVTWAPAHTRRCLRFDKFQPPQYPPPFLRSYSEFPRTSSRARYLPLALPLAAPITSPFSPAPCLQWPPHYPRTFLAPNLFRTCPCPMAFPVWFDSGDITQRLDAAAANQIDQFSDHANFVQRALATGSSISSIVLCLSAIYMFLAIDPRRLVFRHHLIAFLIFFDLLKAIILLIFPSHVFHYPEAYFDKAFCQAVGFFTATAIEGADLAILAFAIHTFLLVFKPGLTVKTGRSDRTEGGLYLYRYYVYLLCLVIPLVLASLPYVGKGYSSFVCWCYLPQHPAWYRLVLSWVPRWCIVVVIVGVYCVIYFYVLREFRTLGGVFTAMHKDSNDHMHARDTKPSFFSALCFFYNSVRSFVGPKLVLPDSGRSLSNVNTHTGAHVAEAATPTASAPRGSSGLFDLLLTASPHEPYYPHPVQGTGDIQMANLDAFRRRQKLIEKQMKSIFVYPFAYIFVWLFPFILQCTQFSYAGRTRPVVWLNYMGAFMQPFNGVVDSLVFFYREQPWQHTILRNFENEHKALLSHWGHSHPSADSASYATTPKGSVALSTYLDESQYSGWRRRLNWLHLPFMRLPTEQVVTDLQERLFAEHLESQALDPTAEVGPDGQFNILHDKHDFSSLLSGAVVENEFRQKLDNFSFGQRTRLVLNQSRCQSTASLSTKSHRLRGFSTEGPIPELKAFTPQRLSVTNMRRSTSKSVPSAADDNDMDILEFLRRGPV